MAPYAPVGAASSLGIGSPTVDGWLRPCAGVAKESRPAAHTDHGTRSGAECTDQGRSANNEAR